mmetsp:Transcript_54433/g.151629  ORF Transcript_54433/g.151629 Transcript_54433/m.151629 type:complete len:335 (+) Transcript_54433:67-1071(+)
MAGKVVEASSEAELQSVYREHSGLTVVLLWAPWHPPSEHLTKVLDAMATQHMTVRFAKVNADVAPSVATALGANQVPFVVFLEPNGRQLDTLAGTDPPRLLEKVKALATRPFDKAANSTAAEATDSGDLNAKLKQLINSSPVMLFMKGSKVEPFCKFSKQAVALLSQHEIEYSTFDILQDEEVRAGLKEYSNWKTYPQLYINGELIGGIDIMKEMEADGSLTEAIPPSEKGEPTLEDKLRSLINKAPVMLFMKGSPLNPFCGFSRKMVDILNDKNIAFDSFDILSDEEVRQGLKTFSNWNTYPQLYAKGKLIGGLDIVKELADEGSLLEELNVA